MPWSHCLLVLRYGRQRVWGAIAAGIASLFTGFLIEKTKSYIPFFSMFGIYSVFFIAAILFSFVSNKTTAKEKPREDEILQDMEVIDPNHPDIAVDHVALGPALMSAISTDTPRVRHWLLHRDVFAFYFTIIICNMSLYCFQTFIWLYMETYLGATKAQTGYTAPFQILVELPFFFYSDKVMILLDGSFMKLIAIYRYWKSSVSKTRCCWHMCLWRYGSLSILLYRRLQCKVLCLAGSS